MGPAEDRGGPDVAVNAPQGSAGLTEGLILGIDTATHYLCLALTQRSGSVRAETVEPVEREHAARIVPALEALFRSADATPADVIGISVGVGPGSYTGLRIGIATAKGLADGLDVDLAGADTLAAVAGAGLSPGQTGIAMLDARRGNVYFGVYRCTGDGVTVLSPPAKAARNDVLERHPGLPVVADAPPSAVWHARAFHSAGAVTATYL